MRLTNGQARHAVCPENLVGYSFIIKGKVGGGGAEKTFFVFLELTSCFHHQFPPYIGQGSLLIPPYMVRPGMSSHFGKIFSGLSTMRDFHFEKVTFP